MQLRLRRLGDIAYTLDVAMAAYESHGDGRTGAGSLDPLTQLGYHFVHSGGDNPSDYRLSRIEADGGFEWKVTCQAPPFPTFKMVGSFRSQLPFPTS